MSEAQAPAETDATFEPEVVSSEGEERSRKRFGDLHPVMKVVVVAIGLAQVALLVYAVADLVRRPAKLVRGPKVAWAPAMAVNTVGPLTYLAFGRKPAPTKWELVKAAPGTALAKAQGASGAALSKVRR
jgi:hypothetical protein